MASSYLENLRAKPEHVRRRIAFWSSFAFTAIVFAFWLGSFTGTFSNGSVGTAISAAVGKAGSPGQSLVAGVGAFIGDLKDLVFGSKKIEYASVEVVPKK